MKNSILLKNVFLPAIIPLRGWEKCARPGKIIVKSGFATGNQFGHRMTTVEDLGFLEGATINDWGQVSFVGGYSYQEPIINGSVTVHKTAGMRANQDGTVTISLVQGAPAPVAGGGIYAGRNNR